MATIYDIKTGKSILADRELGCYNCDEYNAHDGIAPGYVLITYWDDEGPYECLGRCYDCNHRDR